MNPTHFTQPPPQKLRRLSSTSSIPSPTPDPASSTSPSASASASASVWKARAPATMVPLSEPGQFVGEGVFVGDQTLISSTQGLGLFFPQQPLSELLGHDSYPGLAPHHRHHHHHHHQHQQQQQQQQQQQSYQFPRNRQQYHQHSSHFGYHHHQNSRSPYPNGYFPTPPSSSPSDLSFTPLDFGDDHHQPASALPPYPIRDQLDLPDGLFDTEVPEIFADHSSLPFSTKAVPKNPGPAMDSPVTSSPPGSPQKDLLQRKVSSASRKRSIEELSAENSMDSLLSSPSSYSSSPDLKSQRIEPSPAPTSSTSSSSTAVATPLISGEQPQSLAALLELQSKLRKESLESEHGFDSERILRQSKQMRNKLRSILGKLRKTM